MKKKFMIILLISLLIICSSAAFAADEQITRYRLAARTTFLLADYYKLNMIKIDNNMCSFSDVDYDWIKYLRAYKIIGGTSVDTNGIALFEPDKIASREEGAVTFARLVHLILNEDIDSPDNKTTINNVSDWAKANFGYMEKAGLLTERFYTDPKGALTRWELNDLFYMTKDYVKSFEDGVRDNIDYMTKDEIAYNINCAWLSYRSFPGVYLSWGTIADIEYDNINYGIFGIDEYKTTIKSPLIGWHHPATREDMVSSLGHFALRQMGAWTVDLDDNKNIVLPLNAADKDELRNETKNYCAYFLEKNIIKLDENGNLNPKKPITKKEFADTYVRVATLIEACHEISAPYSDDFNVDVWEMVPTLNDDIPSADYYMNEGDVLDILCTHGIND